MKEVIEAMIKNLVAEPEQVSVEEVEKEKAVVYQIKVAQTDMGKVIGKQGRIAKAIRTIVKALAQKEHKRVSVEFID